MGTLFSLSKSATSTALDISEVALLLFGILLVVGLIGEYAKSERWKKHVKTFEMLVIIGVAGELIADGGIFLFSSHLQTIADQEIAALNIRASGNEKEAAQLRKDAEGLKLDIAKANEKGGKANERAGILEKEAATLRKQNLDTESELENERTTRLELEKSLSPRELPPTTNIDQLTKFIGAKVIIEYIPDFEAKRAASFLKKTLDRAKWNVLATRPILNSDFSSDLDVPDGVTVEWVGFPPLKSSPTDAEYREWFSQVKISSMSREIGLPLVTFLRDNNWYAVPNKAPDIAPFTLRVRVGFKPTPYFRPADIKEAERRADANMRQEMENERKILEWFKDWLKQNGVK